jgi:hypothetical protein
MVEKEEKKEKKKKKPPCYAKPEDFGLDNYYGYLTWLYDW